MDYQSIPSDERDMGRGDTPVANDDRVVQPGAGQPVVINAFVNDVFGPESASLDPAGGARVTYTQPEQGTVTFDPGSGLFTFVPAPGQDGAARFTYTITDADGDASTANVIITLTPGGPAGARVVTAAADGATAAAGDNVVVLPPGVTLDDVAVRGRDLVIQLPDGTQQVIADGAIFVPQIVVDGVAVPPLNFAALLLGEGAIGTDRPIEPAAGPGRSSGNNFFEAARPIQRAFDLGDLLPATSFDLGGPPEREVIPEPLDRDPTLTIVTTDQPAGASNATAGVAEAGLPARPGEPAGSNAAANTEVTSGTIVFSSPDGLTSLTINGTPFTGVGQAFVSPRGTLTITSFDPVAGTIGFTFTLTDNLVGGTVADQFTVVLTDRDGDTATSTLTINVADDAPVARNDTDAVAASTFTAQTGNVITGVGTTSGAAGADTLGADNATVTRIASNALPANADTGFDAAGNLQVAGQFGTLLIKADGSYSFTRAAGTPGGVSDVFTYTLTDADGSTSTATLTIAIADATPSITSLPPAGGPGTVVNEAGLPSRGGEAPGSNAPAPTETTSGTITFTGGDAPLTVTINGTPIAVGTVVTTPQGTLTVNSFDPVAGTIGYSFTLADNTSGDSTSVTFNVVVTDVDGDSAPGSFTITIVDDAPAAIDDSATQAAENAPVTVNVLANDIQGADSVAFGAVAAAPGTLSGIGTLAYNNDGTFTYTPGPGEQGTVTFDYTITDGDGDSDRATVTITLLADSTPTVAVAGDNSVDEAALPARPGEPAGSNAASSDETAAGTIAVTTGGDALASLVINGVNVTTGGTVTTAKGVLTVTLANGAYSYSYTLADNTLADPDSDSFSVTATDSDGDTASTSLVIAIADDRPSAADDAGAVAAGTFGPIGGNVLTNDTPGADGIVVLSYSGVTGGNAGATIQGQFGTLTIAADGTYSYTRDAGTPGGVSDSFTYTVRDGDGDTATANLVIAIADSGTTLMLPIAGTPGVTQVLEAGLPAGSNAAGNGEFASGTFNFTAPDGPAIVTIGGITITAVGQTITGSFGTLTITSIASGQIGYTYQLTTNTSGDTTFDSFAVTVADQDGDSTSGTLRVNIVDDVPMANGPDTDSATENGPLTADGNVITGSGGADLNATDGVADVRGADGASVSAVSFVPQVANPVPVAGTVGAGLAGAYGTLTLNADGGYSYVLDNTNLLVQGLDSNDTLTETFSYTLTDGDGDPSQTTLVITIVGADDGVTITGLAVAGGEATVFENDLADGSSPSAPDLTQTGSFTVSAQDGIATITVGGLTVFSGGTVTTGMTFNAAFGTLTITSVTPDTTDANGDVTAATIGYSYTLNGNTLTHTAAGADDIFDSFAVSVIDTDGSTANDSLDVRVVDDIPSANPDTNMVDEGATVAGNVLSDGTDDVFGADGAASTTPAGGVIGVAAGAAVPATGAPGTAIETPLGFLTLNADGSYTYQAKPNTVTVDTTDTFTYTIRDADGDVSTTTLTITIKAVNGAVADVDVDVDESGLDATGSQFAPNGEFDTNGQITVTGATGTFTYTLTGGPGAPVGTLTLNTATGAYSYTLNTNVDNATADDGRQVINSVESYGYQVTDQNGNLIGTGTIVVNVTDDIPTARADAPIMVTEDGANVGGNLLANDTQGADLATVTSVTIGGTTTAVAAAGTTMVTTGAGVYTFQADGTWTFDPALNQPNPLNAPVDAGFTYTITDGDGDTSSAAQAISVTDGADPLAGTDITLTVDDQNLATGSTPSGAAVTDLGTITFTQGADAIASIVFDADLTTLDSTNLTWSIDATGTQIVGTDTASGLPVITLDLVRSGNAVTITATLSNNFDAHPGIDMDDLSMLGFATVVATDNDGDFVTNRVNVEVSDDVPTAGADGPAIQATENQSFTIAALANDTFGADGVNTADPAKVFVSTQATQGVVTYDPATGLFTYAPNSGAGSASTSDSFQYTIVDGDGDTSTATVTITLQPDSTPVAVDASAFIDDDGLATGNPTSNPTLTDDDQNRASETGAGIGDEAVFTGTLAVSAGAADAPLSFSLASAAGAGTVGTESVNFTWDALNNTLTATVAAAQARAGAVLFTVKIDNANTGAYTVTLVNAIAHETQDGAAGDDTENNAPVSLVYTVNDSDTDPVGGDSDTGLLTIDFDDDTPSADSFSVTQPTENDPFSIDLAGQFDAGADELASITFTNPSDGTLQLNGSIFTYTPNAGAGSNGDTTDSFTYTITDGDGDSVTRTVSITLQPDSTPMVKTTTDLTVDEDGFGTANLDNSTAAHPAETDGGENLTDASGVAVFTFGNDAPTGVLLNSIVFISPASLNGQLVTAAGDPITFTLSADMRTLIGNDSNGAEAIRITLTGATTAGQLAGDIAYSYSTTLSQAVRHADGGGENTIDLTGVTFQVTDRDGDPATGSFKVTILDDVPGLDVTATGEGGVVLDTQDAETEGNDSDMAVSTAGFSSVFAVLSADGADGATTTALSYALNVDDPDSGLFSGGDPITLFELPNGTVVGYTGAQPTSETDANVVFSVKVDSDGIVTLTQFQQIDHGVAETAPAYDDDQRFLADGKLSLTATATVTDRDNDSATDSATVDLGGNLRFDDDGPTAADDSATQSPENADIPIDVFANDLGGADGALASSVTLVANTLMKVGGAAATGTLMNNGDGTFTYTPGPGEEGMVTFDYTIADFDGDTSRATVTITLAADSTPMVKTTTDLMVDEDGFASANLDNSTAMHPTEIDGGENLTDASGVAVFTFGNDAPTGVLLNSIVFINPASLNGQLVTAAGDPITFTLSADMRTLIGNDSNGAEAIRITLTGATTAGQLAGDVAYSYSTTLSQAVRHADGGGENTIDLTGVTFQVTDRDNDTADGSFKVTILDDVPGLDVTAAATENNVVLLTQDAETDGNPTAFDTAVTATKDFAGAFAVTFQAGADGAPAPVLSYALRLDDPDSDLFSQGQPITLLKLSDGLVVGYIGGTAPTAETDASVVFSVKAAADGTVTLTQFQQLDHGTPETMADYDDDLRMLDPGKLSLVASSSITDADNDTATDTAEVDLGGNLQFADDGPTAVVDSATQAPENADVVIDVFANDAGGADGALASSVMLVANTLMKVGGGAATGTLSLNNGVFTYTPGPGEEGMVTFDYTIADFDGDTSRATVTITLAADSTPMVVDVAAAVDDDALGGNTMGAGDINANTFTDPDDLNGDPVGDPTSEATFRGEITVDFGGDTGTVSFANLHMTSGMVGTERVTYTWSGTTLTATVAADNGAMVPVAQARANTVLFTVSLSPAGEYVVTLMDNVLHAAGGNDETSAPVVDLFYRATDSDNDDVETGKLSITFNDDTPTAAVSATGAGVTHDETPGVQMDTDVPGPLIVAASNPGDDPDVTGTGPIGFAKGTVALSSAGSSTGADGGTTVISLTLSTQGVDSGLDTTAGVSVFLFKEGDVIVGRVGADVATAMTGVAAFAIGIEADGTLGLVQYLSLKHPTGSAASPDEPIFIASNAMFATTTVTDGDGDTTSVSTSIGQLIGFQDDAPTTFTPAEVTFTNNGAFDNLAAPVSLGLAGKTGADGLGNIVFFDDFAGDNLLRSTGGTLVTSGGENIVLAGFGTGILTGTTVTSGLKVFTITLNGSGDSYTVDFDRTLDDGSGVTLNNLGFGSAGNKAFNFIDVAGTTQDLLFSGFERSATNGITIGTVNTNNVAIGVNNQSMNDGDNLRIDFVDSPSATNGANNSYNYAIPPGHYNINNFSFAIVQKGGGTGTDAIEIWVRIYDADDVDPAGTDTATHFNELADDPQVAITGVQVNGVALDLSTLTTDGMGGYLIRGLDLNDRVTVTRGTTGYDRLEIENAVSQTASPDATLDGDSFDIGQFAFNRVNVGNPIDLAFDLTLTDGDGDTITVDSAIKLHSMPAPVVLDLDGDGVEFVNRGAGVTFDFGDGVLRSTAWVGKDDGILALDANGNGTVDGGSEIVFGGNGLTDLEGLAAKHDSNRDGVLDAKDAAFASFGVWQDADGDGTSDPGEFRSLGELGIVSIGLVSDGKGYTAAGGDVKVFGSASYTRADGTTGAVADAAFAAAPLERMAARTAEIAASNVAAAGVLAAAAASIASLPAAAHVALAVAEADPVQQAQSLQATHEAHTALRPLGDTLLGHEAARGAPAEQSALRSAEPGQARSNLADQIDEMRATEAHAQDTGASVARFAAEAPSFDASDGGQLMDALLLATAKGGDVSGQHTQDIAAVQEAFGDAQGSAIVDAVVAHFVGAEAAVPLGGGAGEGALAALLGASVGGSEVSMPQVDWNTMLVDPSAVAAA